ncbi:CFA61 protein, partial [Polypterus senegalus]
MSIEVITIDQTTVTYRVVSMPGDGTYLFHSLWYILHSHIRLTLDIRRNIVSYVLNDWDRFKVWTDGTGDNYPTQEHYNSEMLKPFTYASAWNVIVYGNTLDAYTTVEALLSLGVMGSRIHLAEPPLETNVTCFNNFTVESAVDEALKKSGVTVYKNCILAQWNDGNNPEPIMSASFTTDTKPFKLPCSVFINFYKKKVPYETFKAINDACLVYDGKLVIDSNFHTNDPAIRAAGPLTKFAQCYYADGWSHSIFNSKEVGYQLATILLPFFDPTLPVEDPPEDPERLIPMYPVPKIQGCKLPGGYYYLHVAKPGLSTPLAAQMSHAKYMVALYAKTGIDITSGTRARSDIISGAGTLRGFPVDGLQGIEKESQCTSPPPCLACYKANRSPYASLPRPLAVPMVSSRAVKGNSKVHDALLEPGASPRYREDSTWRLGGIGRDKLPAIVHNIPPSAKNHGSKRLAPRGMSSSMREFQSDLDRSVYSNPWRT